LNLDTAKKIIRIVIIAMTFTALVTLQGMSDMRQAHQLIFMVSLITLFSLIIRNVWITLFLFWTVFLYAFFKFSTGGIYVSNIFFGCVLYFITKVGFKREHINLFINGFLWFIFANVLYMSVQAVGYDFIFSRITYQNGFRELTENTNINGFMGHASILSTLIAFGIPILASRRSKMALIGALLLFFPLYIAKTSLCFLMGIVGLLFVLYFRIPRKIWIAVVLSLFMCGTFYVKKVDRPGFERLPVWKNIMRDVAIHPVTGWGLNSFGNVTEQKKFRYTNSIREFKTTKDLQGNPYSNVQHIEYWDNPHNLYLSLLFEFGIVGIFLLIGYTRQGIIRFIKAIKSDNLIGLTGFIIVFFGVSFGHFPLWLSRMAVFIIPMFALFAVEAD